MKFIYNMVEKNCEKKMGIVAEFYHIWYDIQDKSRKT